MPQNVTLAPSLTNFSKCLKTWSSLHSFLPPILFSAGEVTFLISDTTLSTFLLTYICFILTTDWLRWFFHRSLELLWPSDLPVEWQWKKGWPRWTLLRNAETVWSQTGKTALAGPFKMTPVFWQREACDTGQHQHDGPWDHHAWDHILNVVLVNSSSHHFQINSNGSISCHQSYTDVKTSMISWMIPYRPLRLSDARRVGYLRGVQRHPRATQQRHGILGLAQKVRKLRWGHNFQCADVYV